MMATMVERFIRMPPLMSITLQDRIRFWSKIHRGQQDECWPWLAFQRNGYGDFKLQRNHYIATRIAYFFEYKRDPYPFYVLHDCNNPSCCNPEHLALGTQQENMRQSFDEGRGPRGCLKPNSKLWESDIPAIRARIEAGESVKTIAQSYGLHTTTIYFIDRGVTWSHVK